MIVARYFGGTKLGVGGLVRAYGEAAAAALDAAPRRQGIPASRLRIRYRYAHTASVMRALESSTAGEVEHGYSAAESAAEVTALVPLAELVHLEAGLRQQTAGAVVPEVLESGLVLYRAAPPRPSASA